MPEDPIQFHVINFFHVFLTNQFYNMNITGEVGFVRALLSSMHDTRHKNEIQEREQWMEEVNFIWENTTKEINTKLTYVELTYNKNVQRGLNRQVEIEDNDGYHREYNTAELYSYLKTAESVMIAIVTKVAAKYNLVMPVGGRRTGVSGGFDLKMGLT